MRFKLTSAENVDTGEIGWVDSRIPDDNVGGYDALTGPQAMAHDLLEHFAFKHVGDEIEALGALYFIRCQGGWNSSYNGRGIYPEDIGHEWASLVRGLAFQDWDLPPVRNTRPIDAIERDLETIIESGKEKAREELAHESDEDEDGWKVDLDIFAERFPHYFRNGYRKALKRYRGLSPCRVAFMFKELENAFKRWQEPEVEGIRLSVKVDFQRCKVLVVEIGNEGYD